MPSAGSSTPKLLCQQGGNFQLALSWLLSWKWSHLVGPAKLMAPQVWFPGRRTGAPTISCSPSTLSRRWSQACTPGAMKLRLRPHLSLWYKPSYAQPVAGQPPRTPEKGENLLATEGPGMTSRPREPDLRTSGDFAGKVPLAHELQRKAINGAAAPGSGQPCWPGSHSLSLSDVCVEWLQRKGREWKVGIWTSWSCGC